MKIAVTAVKGGLEDMVCPVFGRCPKYTVVDYDDGEISDVKTVDNPAFSAQGGAGIQAAQYILNENIEAVISANFGPNASKILLHGGVKMYQFQGTVREAVEKCVSGQLKPLETSTVKGHFGMGRTHRHGQMRQ
ncbi:MAG: NifB/NifX family molybdenum-iron cluster-binding protein [Candidatus Altiarchaeota archaeon]|nr:NifB/NifX family molybdenum-iron cluster-binding protein [Candidatus Altiarchaeota archaeon]